MRLFLVGYMASGKSTFGKLLAEKMGCTFIDLDDFLIQQEGLTVAEIFQQFGEEEFRKRERTALEKVAETDNVIVATGGGTPCFFDNMELMNRKGTTVYLQASAQWLANSIVLHPGDRPLVKGLSLNQLIDFVEKHLPPRIPFYEKAKKVVNVEKVTADNLMTFFKDVRF